MGFLDLSPSEFWDMTPREFSLKLDGFMEKEAWVALLNRRAMNEKKVSMKSLLNKNAKEIGSITPEEKKKFMERNDQLFPKVVTFPKAK